MKQISNLYIGTFVYVGRDILFTIKLKLTFYINFENPNK